MITRPLPILTPLSRPYWAGCREHRLMLPHCESCGHTWFPPSVRCPRCWSDRVDWRQASGRGTIWSWNVFHRSYFAVMREAVPYLTVLIQLEEGPLLTSTVLDVEPDQLECDLPVVVDFEEVTGEITIPVFRLSDSPTEQKGTTHAV